MPAPLTPTLPCIQPHIEIHEGQGAPALLVISTGSPEANAHQGFRSSVLLDAQFETAGLFGVSGTPSAVLLDDTGRIASDVAVGAEAVFMLANSVPASAVPSMRA